MTSETAFFVQFPHPKDEPSLSRFVTVPQQPTGQDGDHPLADRRVMPWNTAQHCRKFLISAGRYSPGSSQIIEADLLFWGEWEPPSEIVSTWPTDSDQRVPRALHRPFWFLPPTSMARQNTDPWVWGNHMLYSNCKQRAQGALRRLTRGSVICFGSTFGDEFCVDTVMVVASAEKWDPFDHNGMDASEAFQVCTAASLAAGDPSCRPDADLTLYRGATFEEPVNGMYSFVPALHASRPYPCFPRPPVRLPGLINTASKRGPRGSRWPLSSIEVRDAWESLRRQVLDAGLDLGVHLETPPVVVEPMTVPARVGRIAC